MGTALERLKPRASSRSQLLLAAALWTVVGGLLLWFGSRWTLRAAGPRTGSLLVAAGVGLGLLKGRFFLDRAARRIAARILERGDGWCAGGFLSPKSWLLVAAMSLSGRVLRDGVLPLAVVGPLYTAIGTGLLYSSRIAWRPRRPG
jgi:hypothetical protein